MVGACPRVLQSHLWTSDGCCPASALDPASIWDHLSAEETLVAQRCMKLAMRMLKKGSLSSFELGNSAIFLQHARLARNRGGAALELQSAVCRDALTLMVPLLCAGLGHTLSCLERAGISSVGSSTS